ncbi:uncharacterized protein METZ01_LOCUS232129, partial [marine metagenome]
MVMKHFIHRILPLLVLLGTGASLLKADEPT